MKIGEAIELSEGALKALLARVETAISHGDFEIIRALADTVRRLCGELERKNASIRRLRDMLFGVKTETAKKVLPGDSESPAEEPEAKEKARGHGRNGAEAYTGAKRIRVEHPSLKHGDSCPHCPKGKVYEQKVPRRSVWVYARGPIEAEVTECQCLRCNLCLDVFAAEPPQGEEPQKYDATAGSMVANLKYGTGMPFHRLERLQESMGVPLPAANQWELVVGVAAAAAPAFGELVGQAAQGDVLHNDDTGMTILNAKAPDPGEGVKKGKGRTGIFTTGIVSLVEGHEIMLYFTGRKHAGENLMDVLAKRSRDLGRPIQMCDALSRNCPEALKTILANCIAHARRNFVKLVGSFPSECRHVIECLKIVYHNDEVAKERELSKEERLLFHQAESGKVMEDLHTWLEAQFSEKRVEENSPLGDAIGYMIDHWQKLTLFLREPGAPLDNNICERGLKMAILHRKNALFYRTENGARVGDLLMSLIQTTRRCGGNPFEYLTALQRHAEAVRERPGEWLPWNYKVTLAAIGKADTS